MTIIRAILGKNMSMGEIQNGNFQKQRSTCTGQTVYVCEGRADDRWNCIFTGKRRKDAGSNHITWFMATQTTVKMYAEKMAAAGIAAFIFDYNGGGVGSKSSGKSTEMSVLTEIKDLKAVIEYASLVLGQ